MDKSSSFISVIKNHGFLNLWINQALVQLSYNSLNFALIIWVFQLTGSNTAVAALLFALYLPSVIFGLFAGVLVDVTDRKKIILIINILLALCFFSLIFLKGYYGAILIITFLINTLGQFYAPAEASAIPLVVKKQQLMTANSIFTATLFATFLIGFGLAGPLINHLGIDMLFAVGGGLLTVAFLLALKFPSITNKSNWEGRSLVKALKSKDITSIQAIGILEIKKTLGMVRGRLLVLSAILIMAGVQVVIGVLAVLIPSFLERDILIKATDAAYVLIIPLGLGIAIGAFLIGQSGRKLVKRITVGRGVVIAGLLFFAIGVAPLISPVIKHFPKPRPLPFFYQPPLSSVLFVGSLMLGVAMASIIIPSQTVIQQNTPEQDRGKVFSVLGVAMQGLSLIPVFLAGILADLVGTKPIFMAMGGVIALIGLFILKPDFYFDKKHLPLKFRQFLGLGHWDTT